ncbi:5'/3'-nucleotidase SurE [Sulfurimonas sp. MAG313]|nr:5'/3'-nucleotidase SurE [Sulfurimonas sp. MAG313]MDF1881260.1 5'/3'-nucleotidase SurE [Sulfurimonas sp. MAG313]
MKKEILITNDDGFDAKGLKALIKALENLAHITVVAPASEKSACSHSLTLTRPLRFIQVDDDFYKLEDGTPSDCVYLALHSLYGDKKPDLLISGINRGANMGEDITYSGTVAGAMEAVLHDVPAISISQVLGSSQHGLDDDYTLAMKVIRDLAFKVLEGEFPLEHRELINVNVPPLVKEIEYQVTYAGYRFYANDAHLHRNPRGEEHWWLGLHPLQSKRRDVAGVTDFEAIESGKISLTPVMLDLTAYKSMKKLEDFLA